MADPVPLLDKAADVDDAYDDQQQHYGDLSVATRIHPNANSNSAAAEAGGERTVYGRRWYILLVLSLIAFIQVCMCVHECACVCVCVCA